VRAPATDRDRIIAELILPVTYLEANIATRLKILAARTGP